MNYYSFLNIPKDASLKHVKQACDAKIKFFIDSPEFDLYDTEKNIYIVKRIFSYLKHSIITEEMRLDFNTIENDLNSQILDLRTTIFIRDGQLMMYHNWASQKGFTPDPSVPKSILKAFKKIPKKFSESLADLECSYNELVKKHDALELLSEKNYQAYKELTLEFNAKQESFHTISMQFENNEKILLRNIDESKKDYRFVSIWCGFLFFLSLGLLTYILVDLSGILHRKDKITIEKTAFKKNNDVQFLTQEEAGYHSIN